MSTSLRLKVLSLGLITNVAAIETQTWTNLSFPPPSGANHILNVSFQNDEARVHSVRVYHRP